jgi:hypothetical protein
VSPELDEFWVANEGSALANAVGLLTNKIVALTQLPTTNDVTTRLFLDELHQQCWLRDVTILVDCADYLIRVLEADGYDYEYEPHGNRNAVERVSRSR